MQNAADTNEDAADPKSNSVDLGISDFGTGNLLQSGKRTCEETDATQDDPMQDAADPKSNLVDLGISDSGNGNLLQSEKQICEETEATQDVTLLQNSKHDNEKQICDETDATQDLLMQDAADPKLNSVDLGISDSGDKKQTEVQNRLDQISANPQSKSPSVQILLLGGGNVLEREEQEDKQMCEKSIFSQDDLAITAQVRVTNDTADSQSKCPGVINSTTSSPSTFVAEKDLEVGSCLVVKGIDGVLKRAHNEDNSADSLNECSIAKLTRPISLIKRRKQSKQTLSSSLVEEHPSSSLGAFFDDQMMSEDTCEEDDMMMLPAEKTTDLLDRIKLHPTMPHDSLANKDRETSIAKFQCKNIASPATVKKTEEDDHETGNNSETQSKKSIVNENNRDRSLASNLAGESQPNQSLALFSKSNPRSVQENQDENIHLCDNQDYHMDESHEDINIGSRDANFANDHEKENSNDNPRMNSQPTPTNARNLQKIQRRNLFTPSPKPIHSQQQRRTSNRKKSSPKSSLSSGTTPSKSPTLMSSLFQNFTIVLSGFHEAVRKPGEILIRHGATILNDVADFRSGHSTTTTMVIAHPSRYKTKKVLFALARGLPVVHPDWISCCLIEKRLVPHSGFYLPAGMSFTKKSFVLQNQPHDEEDNYFNSSLFADVSIAFPLDDVQAQGGKDIYDMLERLAKNCGLKKVHRVKSKHLDADSDIDVIVARAHTQVFSNFRSRLFSIFIDLCLT